MAFQMANLMTLNIPISSRGTQQPAHLVQVAGTIISTAALCPRGEEIVQVVHDRNWNLCGRVEILPTSGKDRGEAMSVNYSLCLLCFRITDFSLRAVVSFTVKNR